MYAYNPYLWSAYNVLPSGQHSTSLNEGERHRAQGVLIELVKRGQWDGFTVGVDVINPQQTYDRVVSFEKPLIESEHFRFVPVNDEILVKTTPDRDKWRLPRLFPLSHKAHLDKLSALLLDEVTHGVSDLIRVGGAAWEAQARKDGYIEIPLGYRIVCQLKIHAGHLGVAACTQTGDVVATYGPRIGGDIYDICGFLSKYKAVTK